MTRKRRAPLAMTLFAALVTSAGCAGPKFESAPDAGAPEGDGVHAAGRSATGQVGSPDAVSDAGEANANDPGAWVRRPSGHAGAPEAGSGGTPGLAANGGRGGGPAAGPDGVPAAGSGGMTAPGAAGTTQAGAGGTTVAGVAGTTQTGSAGTPAVTAGTGYGGSPGTGAAGTAGTGSAGRGGPTAPDGGGPEGPGEPCAPAACPTLPPVDGTECVHCEIPAAGCSYDACELVGSTYFAQCKGDKWEVKLEACPDPAPAEACCSAADGPECKKSGKGKDCGPD